MVNFTPKKVEKPVGYFDVKTVSDVMHGKFAKFKRSMNMDDAVRNILRNHTSGGPVVDDLDNLVGFLSERDCLRLAFDSRINNSEGGLVEKYMRTDVVSVEANQGLFDVIDMFIKNWYHIYPVVNKGKLVGVVTRKSVLQHVERFRKTEW